MADPVIVECSSACTVTLEVSAPLLNLTTAEAAELAVPMIAVLALGWGFRMVIKTMNHAGGASGSNEQE